MLPPRPLACLPSRDTDDRSREIDNPPVVRDSNMNGMP
jgi:hypothetical protein